ncbi:MAG TPA: amidohydrolase family protein [Turneriella sp.]|nr:amidohydrolase family protein [Turneriella sp.]
MPQRLESTAWEPVHIFELWRGEWGLTREAEFRADPWYIVSGKEVVDSGFGKPPKDFFSKTLPPGVVVPGFVNAHSHIELSCMLGKVPVGSHLTQMGTIIQAQRGSLTKQQIRQAAVTAIRHAENFGTFFFCDICNSVDFIRFLRDLPLFNGNRYLELLGFSSPSDQARIASAQELLDIDSTFYPTVHSIYGSSPLQMRFVREKARHTSVSIHLLESAAEIDFQDDKGQIVEFLEQIGQRVRHHEMQGRSAIDYLYAMGMLSFKKLLMVHLSAARVEDIDKLNEYVPHAAWVLCHRSNKHLVIERTNWEKFKNSPLKMLIGTDSLATNTDLSVLHELKAILQEDKFSERDLLRAATWDAYEYLEFRNNTIPHFIYPNARPNIASLGSVARVEVLGVQNNHPETR